MFSKLDTNKDGVVTQDEMTKEAAKKATEQAGKRFAHMDSDGDGKISQAEFNKLGEKRFARMDENGDGKIEKGEGRHAMKRGDHGPDGDLTPAEDGATAL
jgi:Ca2+-binding EF-hand superfamily protein